MTNTLTQQTRRAYEPPRLVLPSDKETAPEGKATSPAEGYGAVGTPFGPS